MWNKVAFAKTRLELIACLFFLTRTHQETILSAIRNSPWPVRRRQSSAVAATMTAKTADDFDDDCRRSQNIFDGCWHDCDNGDGDGWQIFLMVVGATVRSPFGKY